MLFDNIDFAIIFSLMLFKWPLLIRYMDYPTSRDVLPVLLRYENVLVDAIYPNYSDDCYVISLFAFNNRQITSKSAVQLVARRTMMLTYIWSRAYVMHTRNAWNIFVPLPEPLSSFSCIMLYAFDVDLMVMYNKEKQSSSFD